MGKFNLALWQGCNTIRENADRMGICYNYAADLARKNNLPYIRQRSGPQNKRLYIRRKVQEFKIYVEEHVQKINGWMPDMPYKNTAIGDFAWEGSD